MKFPNQCLDDAIVYGVGGALVGLCVVLIIIITAVVVVQRNRIKKQYSEEHKRYIKKENIYVQVANLLCCTEKNRSSLCLMLTTKPLLN